VIRRGERYHALMAAIVRRLPFGLSRIVAPSFLGFAIINGFTFSVDLGLLTLCHGVLKWPYPAAVTLSYLTAFALSFVLNRVFNFRSHDALGPQTAKYVVAVGINYAAFVLGVGDALTAIGVEYQLARILSGLCEGVYMYSVMRWVVFRDAPRGLRPAAAQATPIWALTCRFLGQGDAPIRVCRTAARPSGRSSPPSSKKTMPLHSRLQPCSG
jgi:putative flippase GtrA